MKYLFGPVNSRRLGRSQGIDLIPNNVCNFNCIYCEVGSRGLVTAERREYTPTAEIIAELDQLFADEARSQAIDVFTVTATGEPTLHTGIGRVITHLKRKTAKPVAVLTNGSLLSLPEVRAALLAADIVIPSLDAARPASFRKINRPPTNTDLAAIVAGLQQFTAEFSGQVWLEILLAKGINDQDEDIAALRGAIQEIKPDRVQLNTVVRPPLEKFAQPLSHGELLHVAQQLGGKVEIIAAFKQGESKHFTPLQAEEIVQMLHRRPCTADDIRVALNLEPGAVTSCLDELALAGRIKATPHAGKDYWTTTA